MGKTSGCLLQHLPQVFVCHYPLIKHILSLWTISTRSNYAFFSKDPGHWGGSYQSLWGHHKICPLLEQFHIAHITQTELASLTHLKVWDNVEKFCSGIADLLFLPKEGVAKERAYGLAMMWVHPYQARVSTIEEAMKQLNQLPPLAQIGPMPWCNSTGMPTTCPSLQKVTLVSWWRGAPAAFPMGESVNWQSATSWDQAPRWSTWKTSMDVKSLW